MKKWFTYLVVIVLVALVVVGGMKIIKSKQNSDAKNVKAKSYEMVVKTIEAKSSNVVLTLPFLAITKSNDDVKISSKVPSRIKYILKSGKRVKKGDILVKLDDEDFKTKLKAINLNVRSLKSQLNSKKIALKNLYKTHKRSKELLSVKGVSKEQIDKEVTNIEALKAGIKSIEYKIEELISNKKSINNMLSYTTIKAPVSGIVTSMANVGDIAMPGRPLVSVSSDTNGYLLVRLPSDIKASAIIYKDKKIALQPLNTTFNGLLEYFANIDESLASNQRVEVSVVTYDGVGHMLPLDAILDRDGTSNVLYLKGNKAYAEKIEVIAQGEEGVVVDGINKGQKIIVAKPDILLKLLSGISVKGL